MQVRVLGSAAGGGVPQWNCGCQFYAAAACDLALARTGCSVAVSTDGTVGLDLVLSHCLARAAQNSAQDELAFKCDVLWALLDGIEHAASDQSRDPTWMPLTASR